MGLDAKQVHDLAQGGIDLLLRHVDTLSASKSEPTNRSYLIHSINGEHFIYEGRFLQAGQQLLYRGCFVVHLLFGVLLEVELLLKLIEFSPKLTLILLNISSVALKVLDLSNLFLFFSLNSLQVVVKLCELLLKSLSFFGFLRTFISF